VAGPDADRMFTTLVEVGRERTCDERPGPLRSLPAHPFEQVAVGVGGDRDGGVTEPLAPVARSAPSQLRGPDRLGDGQP